MKEEYGEDVADSYESNIFSVFDNDRKRLVAKAIKRYANPSGTACDLGCGHGPFIPSLAPHFKKVIGFDISSKLLAKAEAQHASFSNVSYKKADLAKAGAQLPLMDLALSVNAIITASLKHRILMLDLICKRLKPGAHFILVVPSLESALLTDSRLIEWNLREGMPPGTASGKAYQANRDVHTPRIHEGIVKIDGVETKHYLREELDAILSRRGLDKINCSKLEYTWESEFASPPRWMKDPYPWDWLCVGRKSGK